jgi:hypothetical protein
VKGTLASPVVTGATNWQRLQATIASHNTQRPREHSERRRTGGRNPRLRAKRQKLLETSGDKRREVMAADGVVDGQLVPKGSGTEATEAVALDCEMVGVGLDGLRSALAKVCVVCFSCH